MPRPSRLLYVIGPVAVVSALSACASAPPDPDSPRSCFTVDNEEGEGAIGNVWLESESSQRFRIGEVGMGRTVTECVRRTGMAGRWRFVVYSSTADRMDPAHGQNRPPTRVSGWFRYEEEAEFIWNVRTGRITIRPAPPEGG